MIRAYEPQGGIGEADAPDAGSELLNPTPKKPVPTAAPAPVPPVASPLSSLPGTPSPTETAVPASAGPQSAPTEAAPLPTTAPVVSAPTPTPDAGAAPIQTMTGDWTPPTASASSAPLIASAAGGTMTPQGDSANSFRGYQTAQGGGFGGAFAEKGADAPLWSSVSNRDPQAMAKALASSDPALRDAAAKEYAKMLTMSDTQSGGAQLVRNLSPEQQAMVQKAYVEGNPYSEGYAGYDANRNNGGQQSIYADSWSRLVGDQYQAQQKQDAILGATFVPGVGSARIEGQNVVNPATGQVIGTINDDPAKLKAAMGATGNFTMSANGQAVPAASGAAPSPVQSPLAGNWTAQDPAEQARLLAGQAAGTVPSGPASAAPVPAGTGGYDPGSANGYKPAGPGAIVTTQTAGQNAGPSSGAPIPAGAPGPSSPAGSVNATPYTANDNLIDKTLSVAPTADRFKIAQDQWDQWQKATNPAYEASTRDAMRKAAAGGALGSGMLQTSLGDLASNRALAMDTQKANFLDEALKGTIGDKYNDVGIAQQQQGFQAGRSDTAYNQADNTARLQDQLQNSSFGRALQALLAGSTGNPADTALVLSQIFGGQAANAGNALGGLISNTTRNNATAASNNDLTALINSIMASYGKSATPASTGGTPYVNPNEG